MMRPLAFAFPFPNEGRNPFIGTVISQLHQIGMYQLRRPALFALIRNQSSCQPSGIGVGLARTIRRLKRRLNNPLPQILLDCDTRNTHARRNLSNGHLATQRPCSDTLQNPLSITPYALSWFKPGQGCTWVNSQ